MSERPLLIHGGRIIDPSRGVDEVGDLVVRDGVIEACGMVPADDVPLECDVVDARGLVVCPGFIDIHCHLREPGYEHKETIATGTRAAARGGFTAVCAMPNTNPAIDNASVVEWVQRKAAEEGAVRVMPVGCISKGRKGRELAEMEELAEAGVVAFTDDGSPVQDATLMRLALSYSCDLGRPVMEHCQDLHLSGHGVMNEGWTATRLGLAGIPAAAEEVMAARDIALARLTGGRLHLAHVSTAGTVELVRRAKYEGLRVTAEVCPHHLVMDDRWVMGGDSPDIPTVWHYDTHTKVYPPLREARDAEALLDGLVDGTIDCIATDHAPHDFASKMCTYQDAEFGISVLETALGSLMGLVHNGRIGLPLLVQRLTLGPAQVLGGGMGEYATLGPGSVADIVLIDPEMEWVVDTEAFASKGKNTPFQGARFRGKVVGTMVGGEFRYREEERGAGVGGRDQDMGNR